jgi:hypothetical protein
MFLIFEGCSTKEPVLNIQRAANRKAGLMIEKILVGPNSSESPELRMYFNDLVTRTIQEVYGSPVQLLNLASGNLIESPDSLFLLAANEIDDLFLVSIELPASFEMGSLDPSPSDGRSQEERAVLAQTNQVVTKAQVLNGANLKTITVLQSATAQAERASFERAFISNFRKNALQVFPNPNVYPTSNPLHFAELLFQFSERQERESLANLNCDNASEVLGAYAQARDLFQKAKAKSSDDPIGQQARIHEINVKLEESTRKAQTLEKCQADALRQFELQFEFQGIDATNQALIRTAASTAKVEELFRQYTDKPVVLRFAAEMNGEISLQAFLRYDRTRFMNWTKNKATPTSVQNYNILSLEPYFPILQTLVFFRTALPKESPQSLAIPFSKLSMTLVLDTLLNGQVLMGANGRINPSSRQIEIFYPNSVIVKIPSYEAVTVITRSEEIFQEKAWIALSSCKTIDGTITQDGLVLQFFGLPCQI